MVKAKSFAKNIRFLRRAAGINRKGNGLSQQELADALGVTRRSIISWESGQLPSKANIERACRFFSKELGVEVSVEDIIENDLTGHFEYMPFSKFEQGLTPEQRKVLNSLFLSASELTEEQLDKVIRYMARLKK